MGLKIDGIASSEHLDSSGEVLKIDGHDISDLIEGKGVLNWEHNNDSSEDIVGAIIFAKKIKKKSDCDNEREEMFWDACKVPFVYIIAELFDDEEHPGAVAAAAMIRFYKNRGMKVLAGFSVEGATLDKQDNILKRSVGRRVALTLRPCNKSAISDVYEDSKNKDLTKFMQLNKPIIGKAYEVPDIIFSDLSKGQNGDWQKEGYTLEHSVSIDHKHTPDYKHHSIVAKDKNGNVAGTYKFSERFGAGGNTKLPDLYPAHVSTDAKHQRKGLANAAYDFVEKHTGKKMGKGWSQTKAAEGLWKQPERPFGKSEDFKRPAPSAHHARNRMFAMEDGLHKTALPEAKMPVHNQKVRDTADSYMKSKGMSMVHNAHQVEVHPDMAKKLADAYHAMPHTPNEPETKRAYGALINETKDQFEHLKNNGFKFSKIQPGQENPYKTSADLHADVHNNNHAWYFPTESGFGAEGAENNDHPLLQKVKTSEGEIHANDLFRVVHDVFGHAKEGNGFGPKGEENAWRHHMQMYSPEAQKALTSETRGQNSWVNFGPHGENNRKDPKNTVYAEQKAGIMPDWTRGMWNGSDTKKSEDPFAELRASVANLKKTLTAGNYAVAPSQLSGGAALMIEDSGLKSKSKGLKPSIKKKLESVIGSWDGKSSLKDMIKAALPEVNDSYIDHFASMAEEYTLKKAVNHMEHCDNDNASVAQDSLITGINVFAHEGKERFIATNYAGKPVMVVCCDEDEAKRATKFYEFVSTIFPTYSACVPMTNYLKHTALAKQCAYVQLLPEDHAKNTIINSSFYADFRKDSWVLHGFALIDLMTGAYQDRTELNTLCGQPPLFLGNTQAFHYDNFGGKPFYLKLIGNELLHLQAVQMLQKIDAVDLAVHGRYALGLNPGEIRTMVRIVERLQSEYHGKTISQLFNIITDGIKNAKD